MGFIFIAPFTVLAVWSIFAVHRWLRRGGYGREWWKAFTILSCVGAGVGVFFGFFMAYNVNVANKHIEGFPIPVQISNRDKTTTPSAQTPMPASIRIGGTVTDVLCGVALCLAPIAVAAFLKENRGKLDPGAKPRTNGES
jgi:hypothetical protein